MAEKFIEPPFRITDPQTPLPLPGNTQNLYGPILNMDVLRTEMANTPLYSESLPDPIENKTILIKDGSATLGGLDFYSDNGNGIYRIGDNNWALATGGTKRLELSDAGIIVTGYANIGTATDSGSSGDLASGLTGASRIFFDQSDQRFSLYDSSNNEDVRIKANGNSWYNGTGNFGFGTAAPTACVQIVDPVSNQFRIGYTVNDYADFWFSGELGISFTALSGFTTMALTGSDPNEYYLFQIRQSDNTSSGSGASVQLQVGGTSSGDPFMVYDIPGGVAWIMGADNSDSDRFKLTTAALTGFSGTKGIFITTGIYTAFTPAIASSGTSYAVDIAGAINTGGTNGLFRTLAAASTGQTASTEIIFVNFDLGATTTWAAGSITNERAVYFEAPTIAFASASTVTNAATVYIDRAPQVGTNATLTSSYALWLGGGKHLRADGTSTVISAAGAVWDAILFDMDVSLSGSTNVTTATGFNMVTLNAPTITDAGTLASVTNAATFYISGPPTGSGLTVTNPYSIWVDSGAVRFDDWVNIGTATDAATQGDLAAGLTGASRMFFDQSLQTLSVYDSAGTEDLSLDMAGNSWYNGTGNFGFKTTTPNAVVEIFSASGTQLRLSQLTDGTDYCDLRVSGGGNLLITPWTGVINMTTTGENSGDPVLINVTNEDAAGGHAQLELNVSHASVGDPKIILWADNSNSVATLGLDNTDKLFKIALGDDDIGTSSTRITLSALDFLHSFANGQQFTQGTVTELTTIAAAATTDTAIQIPVNAVVFAVSVRVTTVIPTATTFTVTGTTSGTQFDVAGGVSTAATTTDVGTRNCPYKNGAAQTIRITPDTPPAANTGRVRVTIHYYQITPPTS